MAHVGRNLKELETSKKIFQNKLAEKRKQKGETEKEKYLTHLMEFQP